MINWILLVFVIFILVYILIVLVSFRRRTPNIEPIGFDVTTLPEVYSPRYIQCGDPWGITLPGFWYDTERNETLSPIATTLEPPQVRVGFQPLYPYGKGKRACYPLQDGDIFTD